MGSSVGTFKGPRLTETAIQALVKRHGPRAMALAAEFAYVMDGRDLYAERINMGDRRVFREQFFQRPALKAVLDTFTSSVAAAEMVAAMVANRNWSVIGTNMTTALCTFETEAGGIKLTTAGADADQAILLPQLSTGQTAFTSLLWPSESEVHFHALVTPRSATIASSKMWMGLKLTNTPTVATDDDQAYFLYDAATGAYWGWQTSAAGTDATLVNCSTLGAPRGAANPTKDVTQLLSIIIDENRNVTPYIDAIPVAAPVQLADAINFIPYIGVMASGAGAVKAIGVHDLVISRKAA